jgi:hypothetical protein
MLEAAHDVADGAFWDEKLETQSRADWDGLKLLLLQKHLQHAYVSSLYYRAPFDTETRFEWALCTMSAARSLVQPAARRVTDAAARKSPTTKTDQGMWDRH